MKDFTDCEKRDPLTEKIIGCCYEIHRELGPGFSEKIYHEALLLVLTEKSLSVEKEKEYKVEFRGAKVGSFRLDLLVAGSVVVELKALTGNIPDIYKAQLLSYLKASGIKTGLLINFGNTKCQVKRLSV
jgi:GxxExxY protein